MDKEQKTKIMHWCLRNVMPTVIVVLICALYIAYDFDLHAPTIDNTVEKKFYVINLDRNKERFKDTKKQTDQYKLKLNRFPAVDGYNVILEDIKTGKRFTGKDIADKKRSLIQDNRYKIFCLPDDKEPSYIYDTHPLGQDKIYNYLLSAGEFGLMCSNLRLWKQIADDPNPHIAVIFEDDVALYEDFDKNIQNLFSHLPDKWDLVYIDAVLKPFNEALPIENDALFKVIPQMTTSCAHAYIINQRSARMLIEAYSKVTALTVDQFFATMIKAKRLRAFLARTKMASIRGISSELDKMGRISPDALTMH